MAAGKDHAGAQWRLADCYAYGIGVNQDDNEAMAWSLRALNAGNEDGRRLYELFMSKPYPDLPFNSPGNYAAGYDVR
jgi:TPR repeat protein